VLCSTTKDGNIKIEGVLITLNLWIIDPFMQTFSSFLLHFALYVSLTCNCAVTSYGQQMALKHQEDVWASVYVTEAFLEHPTVSEAVYPVVEER
jgi:hypothetical protein